ncbi:MAG: hypothetical protein LUG55_07090 [Clostridiales bacterium]|nr:hypothetical protein [Clostridiales bacterium]
MESLYETYDGMLLTIPDSIGESDIAHYMSLRGHPVSVKYEREAFEAILADASHWQLIETVYIDGEKRDDEREEFITPENAVVYHGQLYGVMHLEIGANYRRRRFVRLSDIQGRYLYDSSTYYFDEPGDHDSWSVDIYLELIPIA